MTPTPAQRKALEMLAEISWTRPFDFAMRVDSDDQEVLLANNWVTLKQFIPMNPDENTPDKISAVVITPAGREALKR